MTRHDDALRDRPELDTDMHSGNAPLPLDEVTATRAARLSAMLDVALADDIAVRNSAARMRPAVMHAALAAETTAQRRRMLKAAVLLVVVGSVVAVPPARAWMADQMRALTERLTGDDASPGPPPAPLPLTPTDADVRYAFDVAGAVLVVALDAASGSVVVERQPEGVTQAAVEALAAPGTDMLVRPGGVAIISPRATAASQFRVMVPAGLEFVRVERGGAVVELRPGEGWRVR